MKIKYSISKFVGQSEGRAEKEMHSTKMNTLEKRKKMNNPSSQLGT